MIGNVPSQDERWVISREPQRSHDTDTSCQPSLSFLTCSSCFSLEVFPLPARQNKVSRLANLRNQKNADRAATF